MDFRNAYAQGFARVAACTVPVAMADPATNAEPGSSSRCARCTRTGSRSPSSPSCRLSGYAIDDLLLQDVLLDAVDARGRHPRRGHREAAAPVVVVGAPLRHGNRLYNCAVVIHRGEVLGVAPKSFLPNYREFYEKRHFASGAEHQRRVPRRPHWPGADDDGDDPVRARPDLRRRRGPARPRCTSRSARTCGCPCRRATRPPSPGPPCCSTSRPPRSPSVAPRTATCSPARPSLPLQRRLPVCRGDGRVSRRPTCRGTA